MVNLSTDDVFCPLCENKMPYIQVKVGSAIARAFCCRPCGIGIYEFDPAFNKWRDADKNIPCPVCGHDAVKWFARFLDGFFKAVCPKCKAVLKKDGDVKFGKNGAIIIPEDMEQEEIEPPVEIKIPYSHLEKKLGKDKVNEIRNKRKFNRG